MGFVILLSIFFIGIMIEAKITRIIACISIIIALVVYGIGAIMVEEDPKLTEDIVHEIYSINDSIGTKGNFVLGAGRIESTVYYYFYIKTDKGFKIEKIEATNTYIQETDEVSPRIVYQYHKYIYPEWYKKWFLEDQNPHGDVTTIIKVPTNTVTTQYNLDLQ